MTKTRPVHWGRNSAPACSQAGYDLLVTTDPTRATCAKCRRLLQEHA